MRIYEFSVMLECGIVVASESVEKAREAVNGLSVDGIRRHCDFLDSHDLELVDERDPTSKDLDDEAHLIVRENVIADIEELVGELLTHAADSKERFGTDTIQWSGLRVTEAIRCENKHGLVHYIVTIASVSPKSGSLREYLYDSFRESSLWKLDVRFIFEE